MPKKVLLVEDDPNLSDAIQEGLRDEGIESDVVNNVQDALSAIRIQRPMW